MLMKSEESRVYADGSGLELGLGLSLGSCVKAKVNAPEGICVYGTKLTVKKDFDSEVSSSSSSSSVSRTGTKRSSSPPARQVVGWPPIRTCRTNSSAYLFKPYATRDFLGKTEVGAKTNDCVEANHSSCETGHLKKSSFVKVTMDGIPIGRKVDLDAHTSYKTLAHSLDAMFQLHHSGMNQEHAVLARQPLRLLEGSSEYVITYKDKDGDWMLVGEVPWGMFFNSVRRLRIMKRADANGTAPMPVDPSA